MSNLLYVNNAFCWSWKETQVIVLSIDCVDKRKRCQTFASIKNYCTYQFAFMKKHCPKSCQFCERVRHDLYDIFPRSVQTFYVNHIYNMTESWDTNACIYVCWISHNHLSCITNELSPSPLLASGDWLVGYRGCKKIPVWPLATNSWVAVQIRGENWIYDAPTTLDGLRVVWKYFKTLYKMFYISSQTKVEIWKI